MHPVKFLTSSDQFLFRLCLKFFLERFVDSFQEILFVNWPNLVFSLRNDFEERIFFQFVYVRCKQLFLGGSLTVSFLIASLLADGFEDIPMHLLKTIFERAFFDQVLKCYKCLYVDTSPSLWSSSCCSGVTFLNSFGDCFDWTKSLFDVRVCLSLCFWFCTHPVWSVKVSDVSKNFMSSRSTNPIVFCFHLLGKYWVLT